MYIGWSFFNCIKMRYIIQLSHYGKNDEIVFYMNENKGKIKPEMKEVAVQKNEKAR